MSESPKSVKEIFLAALDVEPTERAALLDELCAEDAGLRGRGQCQRGSARRGVNRNDAAKPIHNEGAGCRLVRHLLQGRLVHLESSLVGRHSEEPV